MRARSLTASTNSSSGYAVIRPAPSQPQEHDQHPVAAPTLTTNNAAMPRPWKRLLQVAGVGFSAEGGAVEDNAARNRRTS